jgi:hypothetical protein
MGKEKEVERFWAKVDKTGACWEWTAAKDSWGYGRFSIDGKLYGAHRVSWELAYGDLPDDMSVLHRCDNRKCVNPGHLFLGTHQENMLDMKLKKRSRSGESAHHAKLGPASVEEIRSLAATGVLQRDLALKFGVSTRQIRRILSKENWA